MYDLEEELMGEDICYEIPNEDTHPQEDLDTAQDLFNKPLKSTGKDLSKPVKMKFMGLPPNSIESECIKSNEFPYMNFCFEYFNPMQSLFFKEVEKDNNVVVCAKTSAGKTVVAEMVIAQTLTRIRDRYPNATAAYIAPLKALCKEKEMDWTDKNHPFSNCRLSILSGDYILTPERKNEVQRADILVMSSEMLGSRIRKRKEEGTNFLSKLKVLVVDESHLITVPGRGPNLESAIVKFTVANPDCRIIFLSATMPNVSEMGGWLTSLNGKESTVIQSPYRPVDLKWNWEIYEGSRSYITNSNAKRACAVNVITKYSQDKFLLFVHSKKEGRKIKKELLDSNIHSEFYSADLDLKSRLKLEEEFGDRTGRGLRVLITTSALAWGLNKPARRVFILGIHRGINKVQTLDIIQMGGRAGRVGIDDAGDVHVAISNRDKSAEINHCTVSKPITSQISSSDILGFHLVSEICEGTVFDLDSAIEWYSRTLSYYQSSTKDKNKLHDFMKETIASLENANAIEDKEGRLRIKAIGKVSSWFYLSPWDISWWTSNLRKVCKKKKVSKSELAWAIANTPSNKEDYPLKNIGQEYSASRGFEELNKLGYSLYGGVSKHFAAVYALLTNKQPKLPEIRGLASQYKFDMDRKMSAIKTVDSISGYFKKLEGYHKIVQLPYLAKYGISSKGVELVMLPEIGYVNAKKMMDSYKIYTARDFVSYVKMGRKPVSDKILAKALPVAERIARMGVVAGLNYKRR